MSKRAGTVAEKGTKKRAGSVMESLEKRFREMEERIKKQDVLVVQKKAADAAAEAQKAEKAAAEAQKAEKAAVDAAAAEAGKRANEIYELLIRAARSNSKRSKRQCHLLCRLLRLLAFHTSYARVARMKGMSNA